MKLEQLAVTIASEAYQARGTATPIADMSQLIMPHLRQIRDATARECAELCEAVESDGAKRIRSCVQIIRARFGLDAQPEKEGKSHDEG